MKRIFSISLAILMFTTNMNITFATHYCGGKSVKSAITFGRDKLSCGGTTEKENNSCEQETQKKEIHKERCCKNKYTILTVNESYNHPGVITISNPDFGYVIPFFVSSVNHIYFILEKQQPFTLHPPQFIEQDRSVLFQIFII